MEPEFGNFSAAPALLVRTPGAERSLSAGRSYFVGRDPQSDIVMTDSRVSWRHAVLRVDGHTWLLEDIGSTNGTFQGSNRVKRLAIASSCAVRLGHPKDGPALSCVVSAPFVAAPQGRVSFERPPSAVLQLPATLLRIGRAADNQVVVKDLSVSRYHAELRREALGGYAIYDLGSHNGTYVNGQRIGSAPLTERDIVGIGPATFRLVGESLQEFLDTGDISYIANDLTVTLPNGRVILDHVTFPLGERCLMGVIGPSGAGKSTLLGALTGIAPANHGTVLYDNRDLYMNYAELRNRIGLVPQENILHTQLTPRRALGYAAELRFPRDTSRAERTHRIDDVLSELSLSQHARTKTAALSGGQQKRVNVALELLTKPSLLFLDEPTSGLDPGLDKSVMQQMADLAHDGRTVIVVTHSVANLDLCDRLLVIIPGGKIAYFGPPKEGLKHFSLPGWAEVFQAFEAQPNRDWQAEYRNSAYFKQYIVAGMEGAAAAQQRGQGPAPAPAPQTSNQLAQMSTLVRRYAAVLASDRGFLALLLGVIVGLGAVVRLFKVEFTPAAPPQVNSNATSVLLVLILGGCFAGAINAIREIVKERPIFSRERAAGLSAGAYVCSKLIVLGVISAFQAILLVLIGLFGTTFPLTGALLPVPLVEIMIAVALVAIASMAIGLLVSSAVSTSERAMPLVFLLVMIQVVTTGAIFTIHGTPVIEQIAWLTPSRWGFAAIAATTNLNVVGGYVTSNTADPTWNHSAHTWIIDVVAVVALFGFYSGLAWWRVNKLGPLKRGA
jgi:ABC transport system ATP-binding/permease protein